MLLPVTTSLSIDLENDGEKDEDSQPEPPQSNPGSNPRKRMSSGLSRSFSQNDSYISNLEAAPLFALSSHSTKKTKSHAPKSTPYNASPKAIDLRSNHQCRQVLSDATTHTKTQAPGPDPASTTMLPIIRDELSKLSKLSTRDAMEAIAMLKTKISTMDDPEFVQMLKILLLQKQI